MPSSLKESDVGTRAIIAGHSVCLPYAISSDQLIHKLKMGEKVHKERWFRSDEVAKKCGFKGNALVAKMKHSEEHTFVLICQLVDEALRKARLSKEALAGDGVRVYITGTGPRIDGTDYNSFYNVNDLEDVKYNSTITHLHARNMSQDYIAYHLAQHYQLRYLPPNIHSSSNSSLTAIYLGCQAIEYINVELVVVINCSKIKSQDIWFLEKQSMLSTTRVQPFGESCNCVLFSEGFCVMVLENEKHRRARNINNGVQLKTAYTQISANRSNDMAWISINMLKLMNKVLGETKISIEDLCAIMPHGNGALISDKVEEKAILSFINSFNIPILAYKGQIGYNATGSGIIDLIIGEYLLLQQELLSPVGTIAITSALSRNVLLNQGIVKHTKQHLLKIGLGMDGSIIAILLTDKVMAEPEYE